jgi:hypothetical protein
MVAASAATTGGFAAFLYSVTRRGKRSGRNQELEGRVVR